MTDNPYAHNLDKRAANYQPLTPLSFLERAAAVYPEHAAVIHGAQRFTYAELYARARRLASALAARGIGVGDTVSAMLANTPPMLEAHYGVPMTGAVLHSINTRLDAAIVAFQLDHADAKIVICDREFAPVMREALAKAKAKPLVIDYDDRQFPQPGPAAVRERLRGVPRRRRSGLPLAHAAATSGTRSRSTTPRARPAIPRASSTATAARTLMCYANLVAAEHGPASRLSVDAADVPLQRLVLSLDAVGGGRHARVPEVGAGRRHVRGDRRAQGDAPVRGADRHVDAARRQAGGNARRCRARSSSSRRRRRRPRPCSPPWRRRGSTSRTSTA